MPEPIKRKIPVTIGCDPEFFLRDKVTGQPISAHDKLPGTKEKPFKCDSGAIQVDGVAAEFNILPAKTADKFADSCTIVMDQIRQTVGDKIEFILEPTVTFGTDYWGTIPGSAKELGCNPDFNAWTGKRNPSPDASLGTMRTASGHIHIGWVTGRDPNDYDHFEDCRILVKQLDHWIGAVANIWDADQKRRTLYGKAGAFRPKEYGVEYRVLSNRWLYNRNLTKYVFTTVQQCVTNLLNGGTVFEDKYGNIVEAVINDGRRWWDNPKDEFYKLWHNELGMTLPLDHLDPAWKTDKPEASIDTVTKKKVANFKYDF